jgi:hypothetical protein
MLLPTKRTAGYYWMLTLLWLWAVLLFGGFILGLIVGGGIPTPARMGSSFVLVVLAWSWHILTRPSHVAPYSLLIAVGMTLGFVGDLFMAGLVPFGDRVLGGMGSFGLGHIAYLAALVYFGNLAGLTAPGPRWLSWLVWLILGLVGWYFVVYRNVPSSPFAWPALGYCLLLASTAGWASGLAVQSRRFWPLAAGAALFFVSDLMIALGQFADIHLPGMDSAIWLTYGPGQMLIVSSSAAAIALLAGETTPLHPGGAPSLVSSDQQG